MTKLVNVQADQFGRFVTELRRAPKELRRELYRTVNSTTKPVRTDMKAGINAAVTPTRGGLTSTLASTTKLTTWLRSTGGAGASIRVKGRGSLGAMNARGKFRHPMRGNRERWVEQTAGVKSGFLDEPFEKARPDVRRDLIKAIDRLAQAIYRRI